MATTTVSRCGALMRMGLWIRCPCWARWICLAWPRKSSHLFLLHRYEDTYTVGNLGDQVVESANASGGIDTALAAVNSFTPVACRGGEPDCQKLFLCNRNGNR